MEQCTAQQIATKQAAIKGMNRSHGFRFTFLNFDQISGCETLCHSSQISGRSIANRPGCFIVLNLTMLSSAMLPYIRWIKITMTSSRLFVHTQTVIRIWTLLAFVFFIQLATCRRFKVSQGCCNEVVSLHDPRVS